MPPIVPCQRLRSFSSRFLVSGCLRLKRRVSDSRVRTCSSFLPLDKIQNSDSISSNNGSFAAAVVANGGLSPPNGVDLMIPRLPPAEEGFTSSAGGDDSSACHDREGDDDTAAVVAAPRSSNSKIYNGGGQAAPSVHDRPTSSHHTHGGTSRRTGYSNNTMSRPSSSSGRIERGERRDREDDLIEGHGGKASSGSGSNRTQWVPSAERSSLEEFDNTSPHKATTSNTAAITTAASTSTVAAAPAATPAVVSSVALGSSVAMLNNNAIWNTNSGSGSSTPPVTSRLSLGGPSLARIKGAGRASPSRGSSGSLSPAPVDQRGGEAGGVGGIFGSPKKQSRRSSETTQISGGGARKSTDTQGGVSHNFKVILYSCAEYRAPAYCLRWYDPVWLSRVE